MTSRGNPRVACCIACQILLLFLPLLRFSPGAGDTEDFVHRHHDAEEGIVSSGIRAVARNTGHPPMNIMKNRRMLLQSGTCTNRDISISQSRDTSPGIPEYIVQIVNTCMSGCAPSDIHLHCAWFASAKMINPNTFRRIAYDNCLVNGGKPLKPSQIIRFTYANTFMYPLSFRSANFC